MELFINLFLIFGLPMLLIVLTGIGIMSEKRREKRRDPPGILAYLMTSDGSNSDGGDGGE